MFLVLVSISLILVLFWRSNIEAIRQRRKSSLHGDGFLLFRFLTFQSILPRISDSVDLLHESHEFRSLFDLLLSIRSMSEFPFQVERQYKVETKKVQKSVAKRRTLKKFGMSKDDGPGPDPATTIAAEEVFMQVNLSMKGETPP